MRNREKFWWDLSTFVMVFLGVVFLLSGNFVSGILILIAMAVTEIFYRRL